MSLVWRRMLIEWCGWVRADPRDRVMGSLRAGAGNQPSPTAAKLPFCFVSTSHHQLRQLQILSQQLQQPKDNNKLEFKARKQRVMSFIHSWAAVVGNDGRGRASHLLRKLAHSVSSSANCHVTRVQRTVGGGSTVWWECSRGACGCPQVPVG